MAVVSINTRTTLSNQECSDYARQVDDLCEEAGNNHDAGLAVDAAVHAKPAKGVSRSTLADANETRDWRIFADRARMLTVAARPLYAGDPLGVELEETA
jgi:hypothetical protein